MSNDKYICPICGYNELEEPAYDIHDCPTFCICPCCLNEFGYSDATRSHEELRIEWISNGKKWGRLGEAPPKNWDATTQLKNISHE